MYLECNRQSNDRTGRPWQGGYCSGHRHQPYGGLVHNPLSGSIRGSFEPGADALIKAVKEQLRRVPDKGLGYGVLKYINREAALAGPACWDIVFNYLGQLDNVLREGGKWLRGAGESAGPGRSEEQVAAEKISVNAMIQGGTLIIHWSYSSRHYEQQTIKELAEGYASNLELLIARCLEQGKTGVVYTPSDYGLGCRDGL